MFDYVVDENYIVAFIFGRWGVCKEIRAAEIAFRASLFEECLGILDLVGGQVEAGDVAAEFGERQEVTAFSASDLKDSAMVLN